MTVDQKQLARAYTVGGIIGAIIALIVAYFLSRTVRILSTHGVLPVLGVMSPSTIFPATQTVTLSFNFTQGTNANGHMLMTSCFISVLHQDGSFDQQVKQMKNNVIPGQPDVFTFNGLTFKKGDKLSYEYVSELCDPVADSKDQLNKEVPVAEPTATPTPPVNGSGQH